MNINFQSKLFKEVYGENPYFYDIAFCHYNIELKEESDKEYKLIELDLELLKNVTGDLFKIYFSDIDTLLKFYKNSNILNKYFKNIYLRINSLEDFFKLEKFNELKGLNIILLDLEENSYDNIKINNYNLVIQIDTISELDPIHLSNLKLSYNIKEIIVGQISTYAYPLDFYQKYAKKFNLDYLDYLRVEKQVLISNDNYKIDEYIKIYKELENIVSDIDINDLEINKFKIVYERVINKIYYNYDGLKETNLNNQTLFGGLFYNTCVCEGYTKVLQQALSLVHVESIVVGGGGSKEEDGHLWLQVKVDNIWYNVDPTYDSIQIHNGKEIELCLVDDDYLYYKTNYLIAKKCMLKYNFEKAK